MTRRLAGCGVVLAVVLLSGCVQRRMTVLSDPPGALVLVNNTPVGYTPCEAQFIYYGTYELTLIKPGYQTLKVRQRVPAPFYEYPLADFVSENLYPGEIEDVRTFTYKLPPLQQPRTDELLEQAGRLRARNKLLPGDPPHPPAGPPAAILPPGTPVGRKDER